MPSPLSPVGQLAQKIGAAPSLLGFARVLAGKNAIALGRSPPCIVLYPIGAGYKAARDVLEAFADVDLRIAARLWGRDIDEAWDLRARYIAALWSQAQGDPTIGDDSAAGYSYELEDEVWDIKPDTAQNGQELEVIAIFRLSASDKTIVYGEVDAESLAKTATLTAAMGASDTMASVDATTGYPTSGVLHIDGEQMSYSGTTATSFTGLVRGINTTTAAAHSIGAAVSVTPT